MLDAARGIVRWGVAQQLLPDWALQAARRPYGLRPPGPPPTQATIDAKYGWRQEQPDDESYLSISFSVLTMGDFGRYVVEPGLHHFSRYRFGQEYPERRDRKPRFVKSRWEIFVASLNKEQKDALTDRLRDPEQNKLGRLGFLMRQEEDPLSAAQRELLDAAYVYPKPVSDEYPAEGAKRWIFRRTLSLGWTPKRFGHEDRGLGYGRGRESHKAERWGKKYQWMAYHELLARVADNFQPSRRFDGDMLYEGLHQIIGDREIDPSLPPIDFRAFSERQGADARAWESPLIQLAEWPPALLDFGQYRGDIKRFLADTSSEPDVAESLILRDREGNEWVVLDSFIKQADPLAHKGWRGLQQTSGINTLLTTAENSKALLTALRGASDQDIRDLTDSQGHTDCCYVGEVGRSGPACYHRHDKLRTVSLDGTSFRAAPTVEEYMWEGGILDCSIGDNASTVLPSTFLQQAAGLSFEMRGPSWLGADGSPVFSYYEEVGDTSQAFLVRATFLREFLAAHQLALVVLHWFERMELSDRHDGKHPQVYITTNAMLASDLKLSANKQVRTEHDLT